MLPTLVVVAWQHGLDVVKKAALEALGFPVEMVTLNKEVAKIEKYLLNPKEG